jgi:O-antigen/teichoic acid export membrane protein
VYISTGIQIVFTFLTSVYIIRYLSVEEYGAYKLIGSIIIFATYLTSFGLESALGRFIPEFIGKRQYKKINRILLLALLLRISVLFIFAGLLVFFKYSIFNFLNLPSILMSWLGVIILIIFIQRTDSLFGDQFLASYMEHYLSRLNQVGATVLQFVLFLCVVFYNWGLGGLILSMLIVQSLSFICYLYLAIRKYTRNVRCYNIEDTFRLENRRILRFSLFSFLAVSTGVFKEIMIDNFVISHYLGAKMVGLYSFAAVMTGIVRQINPIGILKGVFNPLFTRKYYSNSEDREILLFSFEFFNKLYFFITIPALIGMGLLAKEIIIYVYNPEYINTLSIIYVLLGCYSIGLLTYTFDAIINTLEKNELFFYSGIFSIYNLIMDIILIPRFGIIGAAIATGSALVLQYFYYYYFTQKLTGLNFVFPFGSLFKSLINLIPMVMFLFIFKQYISSILSLLTTIFTAMIIYFLTAYFNKLFSDKERTMINNAIGRNIWVF